MKKILLFIVFLGFFTVDIQAQTEEDTLSLELIAVASGKKWGFVTGEEYVDKENPPFFIPAIYDFAEDFDLTLMDYAIVGINKKYGLIDRTGKVYIPLKYDSIDGLRDLSGDGCVAFTADKKYGALCPSGEEVVPFVYKKAESMAIHSINFVELLFCRCKELRGTWQSNANSLNFR